MLGDPRFHQTTPAEITPVLAEALREISRSTPFLIEITPLRESIPMRCYHNVDSCIAREGGGREEGWIVYEGWGGRYLKLVHHCLWQTSDGRLLDITPSDEARNLFLPDTVRSNGDMVSPRYTILDPSPEVAETVAHCKQKDQQYIAMCHCLFGSKEQREVRFDTLLKPQPIKRADRSRVIGRNDHCPCGSGRKFKHCCLRSG
jgi:hypothetical protein